MSAATATIIAGVTIAASASATVVAAKMASSASKDATAANKSSTDAALAYAKQQDVYSQTTAANRYAAQQAQTAPARAEGNAAGGEMAQLLGLPAPPPVSSVGTAAPPVYNPAPMPGTPPALGPSSVGPAPGTPVSPNYVGKATGMQDPATQGAMVTLKAPDGTVQQVPVSQQQHYLSLGATVVEGA